MLISNRSSVQLRAPIAVEKDALFKPLMDIKGDLSGAISAAIITIPMSIGYGILAFAPLGIEYAPNAALIGIYTAIFSCSVAALFGGTPIQISGPKAPLTLLLATLVTSLVAGSQIPESLPSRNIIIFGLAAVCVFIAGFSQILLGVFGVGNLVKFVPYPVVAGFMNGIAFLLIYKQINPLLGIDSNAPFFEIFSKPTMIQPLTLAVGFTTIIAIFISERRIKTVPSSLVGLMAGTALYYIFKAFTDVSSLGPVIGRVHSQWPWPDIFPELLQQLSYIDVWVFLPELILTGIGLGLLGSMESLLSSVVSDNLTGIKHDSQKELIGQGIGNIVCSFFGALPGAGSIPRAAANYRAGGRTRFSGIMCGIFILLITMILGPLVGAIPISAIAGIIFVVGIRLFDSQTFNLIKKLTHSTGHRNDILINLLVTFSVAIITLTINLIVAVAAGMLIASAQFISRMGNSIIKRKYHGDEFPSKRLRNLEHRDLLAKEGRRILIFELQGPLFFGSAENLAKEIAGAINDFDYCIMDMKRVSEIDSTGANIILQIKKSIENKNKHLLFSCVQENRPLWNFLEVMDVAKRLNNIFPNTDTAVEWAEDNCLERLCHLKANCSEVPLSKMNIVKGLTLKELNIFQKYLIPRVFKKSAIVFREGDTDRDLYLLTKGCVSIKALAQTGNYHKRLFCLGSGSIFGEMAFLDGMCHPVDVWVEEASEGFRLSHDSFQIICKENPGIAKKIFLNLALELNNRLRAASYEIRNIGES